MPTLLDRNATLRLTTLSHHQVSLGKLPFVFDAARGARFGLVSRNAPDGAQVRWFDAPGCMIFHTVNAYEIEDQGNVRVRLLACVLDSFDLELEGTEMVRKPITLVARPPCVNTNPPACTASGAQGIYF